MTKEEIDKLIKEYIKWWHEEEFGCSACDYSVCENRYARNMARKLRQLLAPKPQADGGGDGKA